MKQQQQTATHFAYLNSELRDDNGNRFAQIVIRKASEYIVDSVGFEIVHDDATKMTFEARVTWQTAGEFKRKHHARAVKVYSAKGRTEPTPHFVTQRWSHAKTPSENTRYHTMGSELAYVQIENAEIDELWNRLNAAPCYDERGPIMLAYASELTNRQSWI